MLVYIERNPETVSTLVVYNNELPSGVENLTNWKQSTLAIALSFFA